MDFFQIVLQRFNHEYAQENSNYSFIGELYEHRLKLYIPLPMILELTILATNGSSSSTKVSTYPHTKNYFISIQIDLSTQDQVCDAMLKHNAFFHTWVALIFRLTFGSVHSTSKGLSKSCNGTEWKGIII